MTSSSLNPWADVSPRHKQIESVHTGIDLNLKQLTMTSTRTLMLNWKHSASSSTWIHIYAPPPPQRVPQKHFPRQIGVISLFPSFHPHTPEEELSKCFIFHSLLPPLIPPLLLSSVSIDYSGWGGAGCVWGGRARLLITKTFKVWVLLENGSSNDCLYEFMSAVVTMSPEQNPVKWNLLAVWDVKLLEQQENPF